MHKVKKSWKANGKRHTMSRGAKENPKVSQLEMLNPVMQFAVRRHQSLLGLKMV
jgi:hypothetical protein